MFKHSRHKQPGFTKYNIHTHYSSWISMLPVKCRMRCYRVTENTDIEWSIRPGEMLLCDTDLSRRWISRFEREFKCNEFLADIRLRCSCLHTVIVHLHQLASILRGNGRLMKSVSAKMTHIQWLNFNLYSVNIKRVSSYQRSTFERFRHHV